MPPRISVLIPCYRDGAYLSETIESVLGQTFADFEVVISDEGVDPACETIARGFRDSRIRYFKNDGRLGMNRNWNLSFQRSTGDRIIKLDGDDTMATETLEKLSTALDTAPQCGFSACLAEDCNASLADCSLYGERGYSLAGMDPYRDAILSPGDIFPWLFDDCQLWVSCALMFRRPVLTALQGWDGYWVSSDTDLILRAFNAGNTLYHVGYPGIRYRRREGSVSNRFRRDPALGWESALIHLTAIQQWHRAGNRLPRPMRIAWHRHWLRLQALNRNTDGVPAEYLDALRKVTPPPLAIRVSERLRLLAHRLLRGGR